MPNQDPGHIKITVGSDSTPLVINPNTYSEVDITDFSPRVVPGNRAYSQYGIYLDVAQDNFKHGFGEWEYGEPASYAWSSNLVDTRHGWAQLYTEYTTTKAATSSWYANKMIVHNTIPVFATQDGLALRRPSSGALQDYSLSLEVRDLVSNGKYVFASSSGQLRKIYIAQPASVTDTTAAFGTGAFEDVDLWNSGTAWVFDGTGAVTAVGITDSDTTSVTVVDWTGGNPTTSSWIMLIHTTGNAGNAPTNFNKMALFGGNVWAIENGTNFLHFWAETNGSDAEGGGLTDAGVIQVGPTGQGLVNLISFNNQLWVFRPDGAWVVNEQDTDALAYHTLDFASEVSTSNFATVLVWQGFLIFSVRNTLYKYRSGLQDMTPPVWSDTAPFSQFGNFKSLLAKGKFLYVLGQSNAADSSGTAPETTTGFVSLLATDGVGWHKLMTLPGVTPTKFGVWLDPTNDYLYLFTYNSSTQGAVYRVQLQTYSDLPYANYPTTGNHYLFTSYFDFGMKRVQKSFGSVTLHGEFPTNTSVVVSYRLDSTAAWTSLGTFDADYEEVNFTAGTTGKRIQLRLTLATTNADDTPVLKAIILKVMLRPDVLYGVTCDVVVSDNISDQNQLMLGQTAATIRTRLKAARDSVSPITLVDIYGTSNTCYLSSLRFSVQAYEDTEAVQSVARATFVFV